jgi:hypothetical protein
MTPSSHPGRVGEDITPPSSRMSLFFFSLLCLKNFPRHDQIGVAVLCVLEGFQRMEGGQALQPDVVPRCVVVFGGQHSSDPREWAKSE